MSYSPNTFGNIFQIHSFGESHGTALGVVIEGCPAGVSFDSALLDEMLARRRPGSSAVVSDRQEKDDYEILSGIFEGKTLGTPIAVIVRNKDAKSEDYEFLRNKEYRAGHADDVWSKKFGHVDFRGGGRSSGRETVARVIGGAFARMFLTHEAKGMSITSQIERVGPLALPSAGDIEALLVQAKEDGKSYGGLAALTIKGVSDSLGEPIFLKLKSELAKAMMSVGAVVGFEFGAGFSAAEVEGSEFYSKNHRAGLRDNNTSGGIRGGISTGEDIFFRIAVKPTSSVLDVAKKGRHDPCILLRAIVVFEAMSWLVLADQVLMRRLNRTGSV